jgi:hypothetical protein
MEMADFDASRAAQRLAQPLQIPLAAIFVSGSPHHE